MPGLPEILKNTDSTSINNESYHQTLAVQGLGYGHDW
jgi:hypothetical protein